MSGHERPRLSRLSLEPLFCYRTNSSEQHGYFTAAQARSLGTAARTILAALPAPAWRPSGPVRRGRWTAPAGSPPTPRQASTRPRSWHHQPVGRAGLGDHLLAPAGLPAGGSGRAVGGTISFRHRRHEGIARQERNRSKTNRISGGKNEPYPSLSCGNPGAFRVRLLAPRHWLAPPGCRGRGHLLETLATTVNSQDSRYSVVPIRGLTAPDPRPCRIGVGPSSVATGLSRTKDSTVPIGRRPVLVDLNRVQVEMPIGKLRGERRWFLTYRLR